MDCFKLSVYLCILNIYLILLQAFELSKDVPLVVTTWDYENASRIAWSIIYNAKGSATDAIEAGCSFCEKTQCRGTVGYGGSPDENGETTLDAMLMNGSTMDVGAVGGLRNIKNAISVARHVLENTAHSLLVGDLAMEFALKMGFLKESLQTRKSYVLWKKWKNNNCQPNFWKNVIPNPTDNCGPYQPQKKIKYSKKLIQSNEDNHDTIGIIAIDLRGQIAAGTSTNGARNKIPGRVGDSPIVGAGAYADQDVGAATATGDGDIMMRFLPSFLAVELMRQGNTPNISAEIAIKRISKHYPNFFGAVIALNKNGQFGAACNGFKSFPFYANNIKLGKPTIFYVRCLVH